MSFDDENLCIGILGLGYVGLPVAVAFAEKYRTIGIDIDENKITTLRSGEDPSQELSSEQLSSVNIEFTSDFQDIAPCNIYIVTVPTPVDDFKVPDLSSLKKATELIAHHLKVGDYVIYESTVYPGCTEEICVPILEKISDLKFKSDFKVGYSPERINPGDKVNTIKNITKVVSGCDEESSKNIAKLYGSIIDADIHVAGSIKVAEAAKIIENTQRDVNIALMNELAILFDRLDINTSEVLEAARTKWNFLNFYPGLVGGHCIGIDPYYLTYKAHQVGYQPEVILSGRAVNYEVPKFIANKIVHKLLDLKKNLHNSRVLIKGLTFKENINDVRNSRVFDLVQELTFYKVKVDVVDYNVRHDQFDTDINFIDTPVGKYDVLILAVPHKAYLEEDTNDWKPYLDDSAIIYDVKSKFKSKVLGSNYIYYAL